MSKKRNQEGCELNMTPMIDVVFQLIIFFVVTITMVNNRNEEIELAFTPHGDDFEDAKSKADKGGLEASLTLVVEVDSKGRISISNVPMTPAQLQNIVRRRRIRFTKPPPVMIRADYRTEHRFIRPVMDICAGEGQGRVSFVAIKDPRTTDSRKRILGIL